MRGIRLVITTATAIALLGSVTSCTQLVSEALAPKTATATAAATASTTDPRIAAAGDAACDPASGSYNGGNGTATACRQMSVSQAVVNGGFQAFLGLGDLQYEKGALSAFKTSYAPSFGRVLSITKPTPGNHEYNTAGASGYYQYFGALAGSASKGYYSYNIGQWHIVALNSNCGVVSCAAGSAQEKWLRADLAAHPTACSLVYWHHPRFSSGAEHGNNPGMTALYKAAMDYGVDVALAGHDHDYERFAPQDASGNATSKGIREFVVGTGGKNHYQQGTVKANSQVRNFNTYGILSLTLHSNSYDWKFLPAAGGTFTDSGTTTCH